MPSKTWQFLTASNIYIRHFENTFIFSVTTLVYQTTEDCTRSDAAIYQELFKEMRGGTLITFLFVQMVDMMDIMWLVL